MNLSIKEMTRVALFASLISIVSFFKIGDAWVVPFSLMPLMAMLAGGLLGPRLGSLSFIIYILIGLAGVPVFAKPPFGGLNYVLQPTFGFLVSFLVAAYVIGWFIHKKEKATIATYVIAMLVGIAIMYLIGIPYLYGMIHFYMGKTAFTFTQAIKIGMLPFVGFDVIKGIIASIVVKAVRERINY